MKKMNATFRIGIMTRHKLIGISILGILFGAAVSVWGAGYPQPEQIGFHNCILIYERESRTMDDLRCYVAEPRKAGHPVRWGFDAFLFLTLYHEGQETSYMKSNKALWEKWLDRYFSPGRDIDALNSAIEAVGELPPGKRKVIVTIPWMSNEVTDFGDVDNDGISENLSVKADRAKVAQWYIDLVKKKFAERNYKNVELWGFYWMREDLVMDRENARQITDIIHRNGYKVMWIPYYYAPGWDRWRELGMDLALMQSSYPFRSWIDRGVVRRNRLRAAADAMRSAGLGFEVEGRGLETPEERWMFREILAYGSPDKEGYQAGVQAYFLGFDVVERLARSNDPEEQALYTLLMDYLNNRKVPLEDSRRPRKWDIVRSESRKTVTAEAVLPEKAAVSQLDIFFQDEIPSEGWIGHAEVFVKYSETGKWIPAGWAIGGNQDSYAGRRNGYERGFRNITVPVGGKPIHAIRAVITGQERIIPEFELSCDFYGPQLTGHENLAWGCGYETTLPSGRTRYPDNEAGNKLIDGKTFSRDYSAYIGWGNEPGHVDLVLDAENRYRFDEVRVYCRGGSYDGVNFPLNPCVVISDKAPFKGMSGLGGIPDPAPLILDYRELVPTEKQSQYIWDGYFRFMLPQAVSAKYISFHGESAGWIMISELGLCLNGKNQNLADCRYTFSPVATAERNNSNEPNGVWLTDGMIARRAWFGQYYGWQGGAPAEIVIDLKKMLPVSGVKVWCVKDQKYGVVPPKSVEVAFSADKTSWSGMTQTVPEPQDALFGPCAFQLKVNGIPARYVKVRVTGRSESWAWTMLSEIEVK